MLSLLLIASGAHANPAAADSQEVGPTSIVVFVRHAEKATDDSADPPLTKAGQARATCLRSVLEPLHPSRLLTSEYKRTQATLAPASAALGLEAVVIPAREKDQWLQELRHTEAGTVTVVAGHSNTIPDLVEALGGKLADLDEHGNIPEDQYNRMVHLTLDAHGRALSTHTTHYCVPGKP